MKDILTVTMNPAVDIYSELQQIVADRKLRCSQPRHEPGGGGLNVARAVQRLGGSAVAVYTSGGTTGKRLAELMEQENIGQIPVPVNNMSRENIMFLELSSNRQYRFILPGNELDESEWKQVLETVKPAVPKHGYVVASGSLPPGVPASFYALLGQLVHDMQARFIVDTSGEALRLAVNHGVYLVKPNLRELQELVGRELENENEQVEAARQLVMSGKCEVVVVSMGPEGILLVSQDTVRRFRSPQVTVKSKVGAGDSMVAGIVLALARGLALEDAALLGIAAGAAAVMTPGTELCRPEDTYTLYREMRESVAMSAQRV